MPKQKNKKISWEWFEDNADCDACMLVDNKCSFNPEDCKLWKSLEIADKKGVEDE